MLMQTIEARQKGFVQFYSLFFDSIPFDSIRFDSIHFSLKYLYVISREKTGLINDYYDIGPILYYLGEVYLGVPKSNEEYRQYIVSALVVVVVIRMVAGCIAWHGMPYFVNARN